LQQRQVETSVEDCNLAMEDGRTPLHIAAETGSGVEWVLLKETHIRGPFVVIALTVPSASIGRPRVETKIFLVVAKIILAKLYEISQKS
jgi:hypothetical protein